MLELVLALVLQGGVVATTVSALMWEYPDAAVPRVTFEVCVDDGCQSALPADLRTATAPDAPVDHSTFAFELPALVVGDHVASIKACLVDAPDVCSDAAVLGFRIVVAPPAIVAPRVIR